ncbi:MAG: hypothetical protein QXP31_06825 [Pyrobaculum sp.]
MELDRRRVIRIRGSYVVYLPKRFMSRLDPAEVEVFWEDDFAGVRPVAATKYVIEGGEQAALLLISAYVSGLDDVIVKARLDVVNKAVAKIYAEVREAEGGYYVKFVDKYVDKAVVVDRMYQSLVYVLSGLARGIADRKALAAVDDEVDRLRLVANRLCAKYPTPSCAFYVQLARYFERALDHVVDLYDERPRQELWTALLDAAEELGRAKDRGVAALLRYVETAPSTRFKAAQLARGELQTLHAARIVDYLINAAEVYLDLAVYKRGAETEKKSIQSV